MSDCAHFLVLDRHHAPGIDAFDMAAGNADVDRIDLHARHQFRFLDGFFDRFHGAVDVHHHALFQAVRGADADADDVDLSVFLHLAYDGADLGCSQVQPDEHIVRFFYHSLHLRP